MYHFPGDPDSHVHGHINSGVFSGIVRTHNESFHLEPSRQYFNKSQSFHTIIYRESDIIFPSRLHRDESWTPSLRVDDYDAVLEIQHQRYVHLHDPASGPGVDKNIFASFQESNVPPFPQPHGRFNDMEDSVPMTSTSPPLAHNTTDSVTGKSLKPPVTEEIASTVRTCHLHVVIDHTFYAAADGDIMQALADVAYHVEESDIVYRATDFNGDGIGERMGGQYDKRRV